LGITVFDRERSSVISNAIFQLSLRGSHNEGLGFDHYLGAREGPGQELDKGKKCNEDFFGMLSLSRERDPGSGIDALEISTENDQVERIP